MGIAKTLHWGNLPVSNYPDDIGRYSNDPRSPTYDGPDEDESDDEPC